MLMLEVPLQRRKGRGAMLHAQRSQESIKFEKQMQVDQMHASIYVVYEQLRIQMQAIDFAKQELHYAKELERAENSRFNSGASDFFVLNMREQNTARAEISKVKEFLKYQYLYTDYQALTLQLKAPNRS
ncbi:MAG: hypothetical protein R3A45_00350 [Bdellovibrionota bacterium]